MFHPMQFSPEQILPITYIVYNHNIYVLFTFISAKMHMHSQCNLLTVHSLNAQFAAWCVVYASRLMINNYMTLYIYIYIYIYIYVLLSIV